MLVDSNKPLSESMIWSYQREYFEQQGINAWQQVPYYVTSNPLLAKSYAQIILGYLRDCYSTLNKDQPIYILELGAGTGCFSYYFLHYFFRCIQLPIIKSLKIIYLMTDYNQALLEFWQQQTCFQPFIAAGQLEFIQYDIEQPDTLPLANNINPIIAIANYLYDSTKQDLFYYQNNKIYACHANTKTVSRWDITYTKQLITLPYYTQPQWNQLLEKYAAQIDNRFMLFPVSALINIDYLKLLSQNNLLLLIADKGSHDIAKVALTEEPSLIVQGSFSLDVNFHTLEQYVRLKNGLVKHTQRYPHGLHLSLFLFNSNKNHFQETLQSYEDWINIVNSYDFFKLKSYIERMAGTFNLTEIIALLRLTGWDQKIYAILAPYLKSFESFGTSEEKKEIQEVLAEIQQWHYPIPNL